MSDAATVNIAIKGTADVSSIKQATSVLQSLQEGAEKAGDTWEHLGKRIARKFSTADVGKEVLAGLGIGSGFAVAERLAGLIEGHFRAAAEFAKAMADESDKQLAAFEKQMRLRRTDVQELQKLKNDQAGAERAVAEREKPKFITYTQGGTVHGEDMRRQVTKQLEPTEEEKLKTAQLKTEIDNRKTAIQELELQIKSAADAERALISEDTKYAQSVKKINDLVGEGGLTRAEADKRIAQLSQERTDKEAKLAEQRAKLQQEETGKIEEAQKRITAALKTSAEKFRDLADPQRKYAQQLAEIDQLTRTYAANGQPFLSAQDAAAAKARILAEMNDTAGKAIRATRQEVEQYDIALAVLDKNPALSDQEKQRERIRLIDAQTEAINRAKQALQAFMAANPGVDVGGLNEAISRFGDKTARNAGGAQPAQTLGQRDANAVKDLGDPAKHYQSAGAGAKGGTSTFLADLGTASDNVATSITGTLNSALQGTSDILFNLGTGAMTFKQAWGGAILTIGKDFARMATDMVAKMLWRATVDRLLTVLGVTTHVAGEGVKTAATTTGFAARMAFKIKETLADVWAGAVAVFKAIAGIPIIGPVLAVAAVAGAVALGFNLVSKIGHADGGIIRGPGGPRDDRIPAMLSNGEGIIRASSVGLFGEPFFNALNAGVLDLSALPSSIARQLPLAAAAAAPRSGGGSAPGQSSPAGGGNIHLAFHNTEADAVESLKGREGRRFLVDFIGKTVRDMS